MKDNNDVIIVGDDNIDTLKDNNKHNIYNNYDLKALRQQFMIDNDMTQHNFKLTFTRNGLRSCIDFLYSNCSYKITDILTQYCDMNDRIDTVFDYDTSNDIADILIDEINNIIQTIAT